MDRYRISKFDSYYSDPYSDSDPEGLVIVNPYMDGQNVDGAVNGAVSGYINDNSYEFVVWNGELPF